MNLLARILLGLLALVALLAAYVFFSVRSIDVEQLSEDLYVLRGFGGNTAVLRTGAGSVIVDTMTFGIQGERIKSLAAELTGEPPGLIINTHYHLDHTHGNPAFDAGTRVFSTERTLGYLNALDAEFWQGEAASLLPNETFSDTQTLSIGSKTIELVHPGPGHTNGDLVVIFTDEATIHMGDLMFHRHYPNIDLEAGGTIQGWPASLDRVLRLSFETVIPGHGLTTDRDGLAAFKAFIEQLGGIARQAAEEGWTLETMVATDQLKADAGYEPIRFIISLGLDRTFVLTRAWEEVTGNFSREQIIHE